MTEDELARPLTAEDVGYWRKQVAERKVDPAEPWRDADVLVIVARFLATLDALRATPVADTAGIDAALDDADVRIRAAEPPTHATDEFKAGWHHAVSASLTAVARARRAAALRTPKPEGDR